MVQPEFITGSGEEGSMGVRTGLRAAFVAAMAGVLTAGLTITPTYAAPTPTPSPAPSTVAEAKAQLRQLEMESGQVEEDYDEAKLRLEDGERRLAALQADIATQQAKVDELGAQARAIALIQFQDRGLDTTVQLFTESDPQGFLDRLSTTSSVDANMNSTLQEHQAQQANLVDLQRAAQAEVDALAQERTRLSELDKALDDKIAESEALVDRLSQEERDRLAAEEAAENDSYSPGDDDGGDDGTSAPVSGKLKDVIAYAVSKVPNGQYVRGASGPNNFDCSGLVAAAYRQIGISLPHSSRGMYSVGKAVSRSDLRPGDLIFWYTPIHHVGMYIGNGKIVHARNPRADLVVQKLSSYPAPYTGARRVVG